MIVGPQSRLSSVLNQRATEPTAVLFYPDTQLCVVVFTP